MTPQMLDQIMHHSVKNWINKDKMQYDINTEHRNTKTCVKFSKLLMSIFSETLNITLTMPKKIVVSTVGNQLSWSNQHLQIVSINQLSVTKACVSIKWNNLWSSIFRNWGGCKFSFLFPYKGSRGPIFLAPSHR